MFSSVIQDVLNLGRSIAAAISTGSFKTSPKRFFIPVCRAWTRGVHILQDDSSLFSVSRNWYCWQQEAHMYRWFPLEDIKGHGNRLPIKDVMTKKYFKVFLVQCFYCAMSMLNTKINKNWIHLLNYFLHIGLIHNCHIPMQRKLSYLRQLDSPINQQGLFIFIFV